MEPGSLPVLSSWQREAWHGVFGAVEFLNDSDSGDGVGPLEVDQMGRCPDTRCLEKKR